jgi:hypothetical protein
MRIEDSVALVTGANRDSGSPLPGPCSPVERVRSTLVPGTPVPSIWTACKQSGWTSRMRTKLLPPLSPAAT